MSYYPSHDCDEGCKDTYGSFIGGDPRYFEPDRECCTEDEVAAWEHACDEWNRGLGTDRGPGCAFLGDGSVYTGTGFGIGITHIPARKKGKNVKTSDHTIEANIVVYTRYKGRNKFIMSLPGNRDSLSLVANMNKFNVSGTRFLMVDSYTWEEMLIEAREKRKGHERT